MASETAWLNKAMQTLVQRSSVQEDRLIKARKIMSYTTACESSELLDAHGGEVAKVVRETMIAAHPDSNEKVINIPGLNPNDLLDIWNKKITGNTSSYNRSQSKRPLESTQVPTKRRDNMRLFKTDSPIPTPSDLHRPSSSSLFSSGIGSGNGNNIKLPTNLRTDATNTYPTSRRDDGSDNFTRSKTDHSATNHINDVNKPLVRNNNNDFFQNRAANNDTNTNQFNDRVGGSALRNLRTNHVDEHDEIPGATNFFNRDTLRHGGGGGIESNYNSNLTKREREEPPSGFVSAARQLEVDDLKKGKVPERRRQPSGKTLGVKRFVPPFRKTDIEREVANQNKSNANNGGTAKKDADSKEKDPSAGIPPELLDADGNVPEKLKNIDPELLTTINNEILESSYVAWDDIAGLEYAKRAVYEAIIWPLERPDLFDGIRGPTKGLLLFGPPGTGKTMIGKAIASESQSTFFNISASTLMSKWVGEGEKMVRALFAVASIKQPAVVFIDEIDSLLTQRCDGEQDHTRRLKTEFLVQLDGAGTCSLDRILIVGATNRPQELDEAARRRMEKRLYIPLPEESGRSVLITSLLKTVPNTVSETELAQVVKKSKGYSGADLKILCREAAFVSLREQGDKIKQVDREAVRPVNLRDFAYAFSCVKPTVSQADIKCHTKFNDEYGSFGTENNIKPDDIDHFFDDV